MPSTRRLAYLQGEFLPNRAPLVPYLDAAIKHISQLPLTEQRRAFRRGLIAFSLAQNLRLRSVDNKSLLEDLKKHSMVDQKIHLALKGNEQGLFHISERGCVFLAIAGMFQKEGSAIPGDEPLSDLLKRTVEDSQKSFKDNGSSHKEKQSGLSLFGRILSIASAYESSLPTQLNIYQTDAEHAKDRITQYEQRGMHDPYFVGEFSRIYEDPANLRRLSGIKQEETDSEKETDHIIVPRHYSEETATKYPTARFIGAAFRAMEGMDERTRQRIFETMRVTHLIGQQLVIHPSDALELITALKEGGMEQEADLLFSSTKKGYYLTPLGRVLGLVLPSMLQGLGHRNPYDAFRHHGLQLFKDKLGKTVQGLTQEQKLELVHDIETGRGMITRIRGKREYARFFESVFKDQHERWDGKGPYGRRKNQISLFARILSIANALTYTTLKQDHSLNPDRENALSAVTESGEDRRFQPAYAAQVEDLLSRRGFFEKIAGMTLNRKRGRN